MAAIDIVLVAYFIGLVAILWVIVSKAKTLLVRFSAIAAAVFVIPLILMMQDGSGLADGGGVRNVIAFLLVVGGVLITGATLLVQRLRYRADRQ